MSSKMTPQELEQAHSEASALHTALTGFDDHGQPAPAEAAQPVAGDVWRQALPVDVEHSFEQITIDPTLEVYGGIIRDYINDQNRIIHELYTGKHGVIPHPSEVYQAGLWEIYKVDEHQGHAERVGDVGELSSLREQLAALRADNSDLQRQLDLMSDDLRDCEESK